MSDGGRSNLVDFPRFRGHLSARVERPGKEVQSEKHADLIYLTLPLCAVAASVQTTSMGLENPVHIAILLLVVLLVFGAKRLPEFGRSLGSGLREFKSGLTESVTRPQQAAPGDLAADESGAAPRRIAAPRS